VSFTFTSCLLQFLTGYWASYSFIKHGQHITMCGFFLLNGVTDLLLFYRVPFPAHLQYLTASLAFWAESFLFSNHSHGMSAVNQHVHAFLYLPSYFVAAIFLAEVVLPRVWLFPAMRNLAITLHGSWLVQAAFILYPERLSLAPWQEDETLMLLPLLFAWHLLGNLLLHGLGLLLARGATDTAAAGQAKYSRCCSHAVMLSCFHTCRLQLEAHSDDEIVKGNESDQI
jgi:hypothetical protein